MGQQVRFADENKIKLDVFAGFEESDSKTPLPTRLFPIITLVCPIGIKFCVAIKRILVNKKIPDDYVHFSALVIWVSY